jgi:hypothetical protein
MEPTKFAIKHRETGLFFAGFEHGPEFTPIWKPVAKAQTWEVREHAVSQAYLLRRFEHAVQIKPVLV